MSLRKLGTETLIYGLSNILGRLLNFVLVTYFITRLMSSEEFGVVGDLAFWTGWLIALLVFRMDTAVFRFASRGDYSARAVFRRTQAIVWALVGIIGGGLAVFGEQLADWLKYPDRVVYVYLVLATVAFDALSAVPLARLRLAERAWFFVAVNLGNVVANIVLIYLLLYVVPNNVESFERLTGIRYVQTYRVGFYLASVAVAAGLRYLVLLIDAWARPRVGAEVLDDRVVEDSAPSLATLFNYTAPLTLVSAAGIFNALAGPTLIKLYLDAGDGSTTDSLYYSGQFSAALKLAVILNLFVTAYNYAAEPFFFRQAGRDLATADRTIYADATRAYAIVGSLAAAFILLFLPWLQLLIDEGERQGLYVLPILLLANLLFGLYANFSVAYKLTDRTLLGGGTAAAGSLLLLGFTLATIESLGLRAPAYGMLVCYLLMCALAYWISRRYFPVAYPIGRIVVYILLCGIAVHLGMTNEAFWWRLLLLVLLLVAFLGLEYRWARRAFFGRRR